jgi:hypothetical protein
VEEPVIDYTNSCAIWQVSIYLYYPIFFSLTYLQSGDPEYAWVTRHTWQSWRERYKKNSARLDTIIARIVDQKKPAQGEKGQYGYVRQAEERPKRSRKKKAKSAEEASPIDEFPNDMPLTNGLVPMPPPPGAMHPMAPVMEAPHSIHHAMTSLQNLADVGSAYSAILPAPSTVPIDRSAIRKSPAEEEMDDTEEPEWAVRVGNAPPPPWAKRKATDDSDDNDDDRSNAQQKKPRLDG